MMHQSSFVFLLLLLVLGPVGAEVVLHVAPGGAGDGTPQAPFGSLVEARDHIRMLRKKGKRNADETVRVVLGKGVFRLRETLHLDAEDGGSAAAPVIYEAASRHGAKVSGALPLEAVKFVPVNNQAVLGRLDPSVRRRVRVMDLSALHPNPLPDWPDVFNAYTETPPGPWLYQKGKPLTLARWPNPSGERSPWASFSKVADNGLNSPKNHDPLMEELHPGAFLFGQDRPQRWHFADGVWLAGYFAHDWHFQMVRAAGFSPSTRVMRLAAPTTYGLLENNGPRRFHAMNLLEELDEPGEWWFDRVHKLLYLLPSEEEGLDDLEWAVMTSPLVEIHGAQNLQLRGWKMGPSHGAGIDLQNCHEVEIHDCDLSGLAKLAVSVQGGSRVLVANCHIHDVGSGGIAMDGGDRRHLLPSRHRAENNHIHHFAGMQRTYAAAFHVNGCGQIVRHNFIHDSPHAAILYGGNEHLFERNEIARIALETFDVGAFYSGRDWTSQGNVIRHNFIHDLGTGTGEVSMIMGVYLDDCDSGDTVEGNILLRAGRALMIGGGRDNILSNNLIIDCVIGIHIDARGMTWPQFNERGTSWDLSAKAEAMRYREPPWSIRYPNLAKIMEDNPGAPLHNVIHRNIIVDSRQAAGHIDKQVEELLAQLDIAENVVIPGPGEQPQPLGMQGVTVADKTLAENTRKALGNKTDSFHPDLGPDSPLLQLFPFFAPIPFDKIGLEKDR